MMEAGDSIDVRQQIKEDLLAFRSEPIGTSATRLLRTLGYRSDKTVELEMPTPEGLLREMGRKDFINSRRAHADEWKKVDFLFQLTDEEVRGDRQSSFGFDASQIDIKSDRLIESYIFLAVELTGNSYPRAILADITREINRLFPMPALIVFRHGQAITLSVIDRRLSKRDVDRDVLERVTLIKDIYFSDPLRAHLDILNDLSLPVLQNEFYFSTFVGLHQALRKRLDTDALNKKFYNDIANWYFWALDHSNVAYPRNVLTDEEKSIFLIRLLTRLIFCWFLQEKGLVPRDVFRARVAARMLKDFSPDSGSYYRAFLQNLFFATLNQEPEKRSFQNTRGGNLDSVCPETTLYLYANLLRDPEAFEHMLRRVPFVNGGLFDCHDSPTDGDICLDDFSEARESSLNLPNELFFGEDREVDLTGAYGDSRRRHEHVRGLIDILSRYKFTVEESTPLEQEVALDPELLGRVFENLLASYNQDTSTTARKATGSFYTPREIVGYLVDESLLSYLETELKGVRQQSEEVADRLRQLFSAGGSISGDLFHEQEVIAMVAAIDRVKILDPACGSGAFLMGTLHRLVDLLQKLDPSNEYWRALQRSRALAETDTTFKLDGKEERELQLNDINEVFERNTSNYGRKLYLIENCIYGVDIQPIACQIAKLRFFIALIVDQNIDRKAKNFGVRPLPNLETKVVAADATIPIEGPQGHQFDLLHTQIQPLRQQLGGVRHNYFLAKTPNDKAECRKQDAKLRSQIAELLRESGWPSETATQMAEWDPYNQNRFATFFDPQWMFGISVGKVRLAEHSGATLRGNFAFVKETAGRTGLANEKEVESGFDIVIGNPPYIRLQTLKQKNPKQVEFLKKNYESARKGNYDIYVVFVERGLQVLKPTGDLAYILPHKFFNAQYGEPLRTLISRGKHLKHIVHFGDSQVFPGATTYVCLLFLSKQGVGGMRFVKVDDVNEWRKTMMGTEAIIPASKVTSAEWNYTVGTGAKVFESLSQTSETLGDVAERIAQGLRTSANEVYVLELVSKRGKVLTAYSKQLDREVQLESGSVSLFLQGREIKPFRISHTDKIIIIPYRSEDGYTVLISPEEYESKYPLTYKYLRQNKKFLEEREGGRMRGATWYAYIYPKSIDLMLLPKILVPDIADRASFALDEYGKYAFTSGYGITIKPSRTESLTYILGLVNSRVLDYYWRRISTPLRGGFYRNFTQFIDQLPIPTATQQQQNAIENLVNYMIWLAQMRQDREQAVDSSFSLIASYFEQTINALIYELFFADELHEAGLHPFKQVEKANLPILYSIHQSDRLSTLQETFNRLYDTKHPLRGCLQNLESLNTVRIIEGRE